MGRAAGGEDSGGSALGWLKQTLAALVLQEREHLGGPATYSASDSEEEDTRYSSSEPPHELWQSTRPSLSALEPKALALDHEASTDTCPPTPLSSEGGERGRQATALAAAANAASIFRMSGGAGRPPLDSVDEEGVSFNDTYTLLGRIGEGAWSKVFLARHRQKQTRVAVKYISTKRLPPAALALVRNEAAMMHEDWARGGSLLSYLHGRRGGRRGLLSERSVRALLRRLLSALSHVHSLGIAHLDVKPDNVLLLEPDALGSAVLADFGFATRTTPLLSTASGSTAPATMTKGAAVGTPEYVAPELLLGAPYDGRADVWSLGVVTFALLSGALPFRGRDTAELFGAIVEGAARFGGARWAAVSTDAKRFVVEMLQGAPGHRATAAQLLGHVWLQQDAAQPQQQQRRQSDA
ncbi:kinase-like domain-containing protein [Tribonema minus]|uniref:Kinase-like domain-containing protein n=1 Tax=Tribonema minus TaxID=303371 RepID=A0A835Z2E9_9STRA|nr:kinase-like domain-containing protein [Tribonema minus]